MTWSLHSPGTNWRSSWNWVYWGVCIFSSVFLWVFWRTATGNREPSESAFASADSRWQIHLIDSTSGGMTTESSAIVRDLLLSLCELCVIIHSPSCLVFLGWQQSECPGILLSTCDVCWRFRVWPVVYSVHTRWAFRTGINGKFKGARIVHELCGLCNAVSRQSVHKC